MPTPALDRVLAALQETLDDAASLAGVLVEIDRSDDNPFGTGELPAINIIERQTTFRQRGHGETEHHARIDLDMVVAVEAASTNAARLRLIEANIVAALWADRTLGGHVENIELESSGGDEDVLCDEGARPLSLTIRFITPMGDHFTILGASGPIP